MGNSFSVNWGGGIEGRNFPTGWRVYALWPAPVNDDECFRQAGYNDFQSDDDNYSEAYWDEQAAILHQRLIGVLLGMGKAKLLSKSLCGQRTMARFWQLGEPLPLIEQLALPTWQDNLPETRVRFGEVAELRTGKGHKLYWIGLSPESPLNFTGILVVAAKSWPRRCVQLDWGKL